MINVILMTFKYFFCVDTYDVVMKEVWKVKIPDKDGARLELLKFSGYGRDKNVVATSQARL